MFLGFFFFWFVPFFLSSFIIFDRVTPRVMYTKRTWLPGGGGGYLREEEETPFFLAIWLSGKWKEKLSCCFSFKENSFPILLVNLLIKLFLLLLLLLLRFLFSLRVAGHMVTPSSTLFWLLHLFSSFLVFEYIKMM